MRRSIICVASLLACGLPLSTQVLACQGTTTVFDDKFTTIDKEWQTLPGAPSTIDNNHLLIDVHPQDYPAGFGSHSLNQRDIYADAIFCATFSFDSTSDVNNTTFGIAF